MNKLLLVFASVALVAACGSSDRPRRAGSADGGGTTGDGGPGSVPGFDAGDCTPAVEGTPETCSDGIDNDCDGRVDCGDVSCSGIGACPVCGQVDTPLGSPLALPDGVGSGNCETDAECPGDQRCFELGEDPLPIPIPGLGGNECRESYRSTLDFVGFAEGTTFTDASDLVSVCVTMEHSWLRDLEMALEAPSGQVVHLQRFLGRTGGEIYLGEANDCDAGSPGVGARYCWTPTATRPAMLDYANSGGALDSVATCTGGTAQMMPPGDYSAADSWGNLIGTPLNGRWTLSVTDLWGADDGYIFDWSITFNARNVDDCQTPLI